MTFCLALVLLAAPAAGAERPALRSPDELRSRLAVTASARWRGVPLGDALRRLREEFAVPLWIDRRVDTTAPLSLDSGERAVADLLGAAASQSGFAVVAIDRLVYFGPAESAAALVRLTKRPPRGGLGGRSETRWSRLAEPRAIAQQIAQQAGLSIENPEAIPHDLWPAGQTPELTAGDRLALVLVGFDLRWARSEAGRLRVEPIEFSGLASRSLPALIGPEDRRGAAGGEKRFTLRVVDQPLGPLLASLAKQLGIAFDRTTLSAEEANQRIGFEVRQASLEELLAAVSEAAGATLAVRDGELTMDAE